MPRGYKQVIPREVLFWLGILLIAGTTIGSFLPGIMKLWLGTHPYEPGQAHVETAHRIYHFATFGCIALVYLLLAEGILAEAKVSLLVFAMGFIIECAQRLTGLAALLEWWDIRDDLYAVLGVFVLIQTANKWLPMKSQESRS